MKNSQDFKDEQYLFNKLQADNLKLFFYQKLWLPAISLQMNMEEVAHEEHDFTHMTILGLLKAPLAADVDESIAISNLMGLAEASVAEKIKELFVLGYVDTSSTGRLQITTLGARTLELGKPIRRVKRALRICGMSQRLLPTQAYSRAFKLVENMTENDLNFVVVGRENEDVSLAAIDAIDHMDKKTKDAVNIPDEAIAIELATEYESGFQSGKLVIVGTDQPERAWAQFGDAFLELPWTDTKGEALLPALTKRKTPQQRRDLQSIKEFLAQDGVKINNQDELDDDSFGQVRVHASHIDAHWFAKTTNSFIFNLARCATKDMPAWPFYRYPISTKDVLSGKCLTIDISNLDEDIQRLAEALRKYHLLTHEYYTRNKRDSMVKTADAYLQQQLSKSEFDCLVRAAEELSIARLKQLGSLTTDKEVEE